MDTWTATSFLALALAAILSGCTPGGPAGETVVQGGSKVETGTAASTEPSGTPVGWGAKSRWLLPSSSRVKAEDFIDRVDNPYWPLAPGASWTYEAKTDEGVETILVVVLPQKKRIMGIQCYVVRDTVKLDGETIEDTYDWYAQDKQGNVWYMGEAVDNYENGVVVNHDGSWEAGRDGALPGIKVWAEPHVGRTPYYQEFYAGEAEDLGKDLQLDGRASVRAGDYADLLVIEEWTPLDPGFVERKYYARD